MTTLREAAQQALEALEDLRVWRMRQTVAIIALRSAVAQQDEPVPLEDRVIELQQARARDNIAFKQLLAQRDALLETLKYHQEQTRPIQRTLDVIKAVEEGK